VAADVAAAAASFLELTQLIITTDEKSPAPGSAAPCPAAAGSSRGIAAVFELSGRLDFLHAGGHDDRGNIQRFATPLPSVLSTTV